MPDSQCGTVTHDASKEAAALRAENEHWQNVMPTDDQIRRAPIGTSFHRIWKCATKHMSGQRVKWARPADLATTSSCDVQGHPAWVRALLPMPTKPRRRKAQRESFRWTVKPKSGVIEGTIYTDGSALDGPNPSLVRCGWVFVAVDGGATSPRLRRECPRRGSMTSAGRKPGQSYKLLSGRCLGLADTRLIANLVSTLSRSG